IGTCRFVYNLFLAEADKRYQNGQPYRTAYEFSIWLNHAYLSENPDTVLLLCVSGSPGRRACEAGNGGHRRRFGNQVFCRRQRRARISNRQPDAQSQETGKEAQTGTAAAFEKARKPEEKFKERKRFKQAISKATSESSKTPLSP
ncbi:MAG: helix-turn-helix domain-containing protein, partial [Oscillibacter sp.]|nr:helix-turn-helix domain-containing protein [Oscillibacter sp.]